MAESILATLLAQNQPAVEGNQALLVFGLQNDFVGPDAQVPLPVESGWLERIKELVPKFREFAGDVIFVRSEVTIEDIKEMDNDKVILDSSDTDGAPEKENAEILPKSDKSPSKSKKKKKRNRVTQFLKDMTKKDQADIINVPAGQDVEEIFRSIIGERPCCLPGTAGAAFRSDIEELIQPEDTVIVKRKFSAFSGTNLLLMLRGKIITELYLVGCVTNLSVFATAQEAASHGLILNIIEDCLGYKTQKRHDIALYTMIEHMGAYTTTSSAMLAAFEDPYGEAQGVQTPSSPKDTDDPQDLSAALAELGLDNKDRRSVQSQDLSVAELAESLAASSLSASNRRSLNSPPPKPTSRPPTASPSTEPQSPLSARNLRSFKSSPDIRTRANVRVRVRKRNEAELPNVPELPKAALHAKTLSREDDKARMIQSVLESQGHKGKEKKEEVSAHHQRLPG